MTNYHLCLSLLVAASFVGKSACQFGFGGFEGYGNFPSCGSSCMNNWGADCMWTDGGNCFCSNATLVASVNSCIASSSCNSSDKESIYQQIDQLCADAGHTVTAAPEATFSATANSAWTTSGPWSTGAWGPGFGPFGGGWGPWGSSGSWVSGAWTRWWGGKACPDSTWTGWTSGTWDSNAPWTSWTACEATTTATVTYTTTTTNGGATSVVTGTSFGVKVAEGSASSTSTASATGSSSSSSRASKQYGGLSGTLAFVVAILGSLVVL